MRISPSQFYKLVCAAIIAITLWLGGFGCSFCCATGVSDSCCEVSKEFPVNACCQRDSCCKPSPSLDEAASGETISPQDGLKSCSLLPAQITSLTAEQRISSDTAFATDITSIQLEVVGYAQTEISSHPLLPRNRGATYLRCCALLI